MDPSRRQDLIPVKRDFALPRHDPEQLRPLVDATLTILERTGVRCDAPAALEIFAEAGATLDRGTRRVLLSAELVQAALDTLPLTFTFCARDPQLDLPLSRLLVESTQLDVRLVIAVGEEVLRE